MNDKRLEDLLNDFRRDVRLNTLVMLYDAQRGKKISLETLGEPFGISKQLLSNHLKRLKPDA